MKKISVFAVVVFLTFFHSLAIAEEGTVVVEISGINNEKGQVYIGLFNNENGFPDKGNEYQGVLVKVKGGSLQHTFTEVPKGVYAIAVFHDSNGNGKLDKNIFGIPKEEYAFSKNGKGFFGTPRFAKAKFNFKNSYIAKITMD